MYADLMMAVAAFCLVCHHIERLHQCSMETPYVQYVAFRPREHPLIHTMAEVESKGLKLSCLMEIQNFR